MGNCLIMEKKVIKIMRNDGKVIEYKGPMKVHHILTQFSGHYSLSNNKNNNNSSYLHPQAKLICGRLYYLIPDKTTTVKHKKTIKKVRFSIPEVQEEEEERVRDFGEEKKSVSVVRVKMVVSKQELEKLLQGGSVHEMVCRSLVKQQQRNDDDDDDDNDDEEDDDDESESQSGWRPLLASIPEYD